VGDCEGVLSPIHSVARLCGRAELAALLV